MPIDDHAPDPAVDVPPLPPSLELAWGLRDEGSRGPKRGLSLDRIVAAAIKVAVTEGLGALSMSRVAKQLGVATMSLYRYVAAKDELLTLMVDAALGPPPPLTDGDWREGLTQWATAVHDSYLRHAWTLRIPVNEPPLAPNSVAWLEAALQTMSTTPLSEGDKISTVLVIRGFARADATLMSDMNARADPAGAVASYGVLLRRLTTAAQFPAVHRAIASGAFDGDDNAEYDFRFGLRRILDGVAILIEELGAPPHARR